MTHIQALLNYDPISLFEMLQALEGRTKKIQRGDESIGGVALIVTIEGGTIVRDRPQSIDTGLRPNGENRKSGFEDIAQYEIGASIDVGADDKDGGNAGRASGGSPLLVDPLMPSWKCQFAKNRMTARRNSRHRSIVAIT